MNPFGNAEAGARWSLLGGSRRAVLLVLFGGLVVGLLSVAWRAQSRLERARAWARLEALRVTAGFEVQFSHAEAAAEIVAASIRQAGTIANFQKLAADLLATRPEISSLELQPGGVVTDVFPRGGNERRIGYSVLKDPSRRLAVNVAMQKHVLTVAGPASLAGGEAALAFMAPVFVRARDGREVFWGFVEARVGLAPAVGRAGLNDLATKGYHYILFAPRSSQQNGSVLAESGTVSSDRAVVESILVRNTEFRLGLEPRFSWLSRGESILEATAVLLLFGLCCGVLILSDRGRDLKGALAESTRSLARETNGRERAEEEARQAKAASKSASLALAQSQSALQQLESTHQALQAELESAGRAAQDVEQGRQAILVELEQARLAAERWQASHHGLQARLELATSAAQAEAKAAAARVAALELRAQDAVKVGQEFSQARDLAAKKSHEAESKLRELESANRELFARVAKLTSAAREAEEIADTRLKEAGARIAELESRLEEATKPAELLPEPEPPQPPEVRPTPEEPKAHRPAARPKAPVDDQMDLWHEAASAHADKDGGAVEPNTAEEEPVHDESEVRQAEPNALALESEPAPGRFDVADAEIVSELPAPSLDEAASKPKEHKPAPGRTFPGPVHPEFRKMVNQILPLLVDQDPGAKDCLKGNRAVFRSGFLPEHYGEFEQLVKQGEFSAALEQLRKAARKHGISV